MHKRASSVVLSALLVAAVAAPAAGQGVGIGGAGGLNLSDLGLSPGPVQPQKNRDGFTIGTMLPLDFAPGSLFGLRFGLYYSQKGATVTRASDGAQVALDLDYLEIPFLAQLNVPVGGIPLQPRLYGGSSVGLNVTCGLGAPLDGPITGSGCADPAKQEFVVKTSTADFGIVLGGGLDITTGPGAVSLDARYRSGLTAASDIEKATSAAGGDSDESTTEDRTLTFTAGYHLPIPW